MLTVVTSEVRIIYRDATGSFSVGKVYLPASVSVDDARADAEALISLLLPLTNCQIAQYSVSYRVKSDASIVPRSALFASPIAEFVFELSSDATLHYVFDCPLDPTWLETSGPLAGVAIDLTNTEVISLTDEITSGHWLDPFGQDIGVVDSAYKRELE